MVKQSGNLKSRFTSLASKCGAFAAVLMLAFALVGCTAGQSSSSSNASDVSSSSSASSSNASSSASSDASSSASDSSSQAADNVAQITIEAPDVAEFEAINVEVALTDDSTALTVLQEACSDVAVEDSSYGPFVTSINGLSNGDKGSQSGWTYTVNGEYATESAGDYKIEAGDVVIWSYMV